MAIYVAPIGSGVGDVVVCRPVLDTLLAQQCQPVYLVARGPRQVGMAKLIEGLAGEVQELQLKQILKPGDRYINLRDHELQRRHDWAGPAFYEQFPNMNIQKAINIICQDFGLPRVHDDFRAFPFRHDSRGAGKIVLVPSTTIKSKTLEDGFWLALYRALRKRSIESVMLGTLEQSSQMQHLCAKGIPHIKTPDIAEAINLISSCAGVVSVDTGLMHIAVQQGIHTVVIFGDWRLYYRPRKNCLPIFVSTTPSSLPYALPEGEFACDYQTWDWFPPNHDQGSCLPFNDVDRVLTLLQPVTAG